MNSGQSKMVAGVSVPLNATSGLYDYDELLSEALRVAMRIDTDPERDDFSELYGRIGELLDAYIGSPEGTCLDGTEAPTSTLMARLAVRLIDVIPLEERERLLRPPAN
jgi:hypothetical protein